MLKKRIEQPEYKSKTYPAAWAQMDAVFHEPRTQSNPLYNTFAHLCQAQLAAASALTDNKNVEKKWKTFLERKINFESSLCADNRFDGLKELKASAPQAGRIRDALRRARDIKLEQVVFATFTLKEGFIPDDFPENQNTSSLPAFIKWAHAHAREKNINIPHGKELNLFEPNTTQQSLSFEIRP